MILNIFSSSKLEASHQNRSKAPGESTLYLFCPSASRNTEITFTIYCCEPSQSRCPSGTWSQSWARGTVGRRFRPLRAARRLGALILSASFGGSVRGCKGTETVGVLLGLVRLIVRFNCIVLFGGFLHVSILGRIGARQDIVQELVLLLGKEASKTRSEESPRKYSPTVSFGVPGDGKRLSCVSTQRTSWSPYSSNGHPAEYAVGSIVLRHQTGVRALTGRCP